MGSIKGIFFDLHGTLLLCSDVSKAWADWLTAFHTCMVDRGLTVSEQEFEQYCEDFFESPEPESQDNELSLFERRIKDLADNILLELSNRDIHKIADTIVRVWYQDMFLDPEAHPVLQALKPRYKLGLITNWEHPPKLYALLSEMNLSKYFNEVVISSEVGVVKPDPEIFQIALERTGLNPCEVAYVGDAPTDVEGSLNVGIHPVLIRRGSSMKNWDYKPSTQSIQPVNKWSSRVDGIKVINRLTELLVLVKELENEEGIR